MKIKKFSIKQQQQIFDALYFMNMQELKQLCELYNLPAKNKKGDIIERIKHFLQTGEVLAVKKIPAVCIADKNVSYSLTPSALILKGAYKNDLKTRNFFKKLIGDHFHFTAFGQDWILERWHRGKPPTYGEFAKYWQQENERRKKSTAQPKQEWAYLNFIQRFTKNNPSATKKELAAAWEQERTVQVAKVKSMLF